MLVCGSRHPQSARQMDELQRMGIHLLGFDPEKRAFEGANELKEQSPLAGSNSPEQWASH